MNPCQHGGSCQTANNTLGYSCLCPEGYSGLHCDGKGGYIEDPTEVLAVGDIIDVRVIAVDLKKGRIQLSMRLNPEEFAKVSINESEVVKGLLEIRPPEIDTMNIPPS